LSQVEAAAQELIDAEYMLAEDLAAVLERAGTKYDYFTQE
jgi:hypothetical protein